MKKRRAIFTIVLIFLVLVGIDIYSSKTSDIPNRKPDVIIKYDGKRINTNIGEHTWVGNLPKGQQAGNNNLVGPSYEIGERMEAINVKALEEFEVKFKSKPNKIILNIWKIGDSQIYSTKEYGGKENSEIEISEEKGEFIFEISGYWNEQNQTSNIFRVNIE